MARYIALRVLQSLLTLVAVSAIVFALVRMSGDPFALLLPPTASQEEVDAVREAAGYNLPWWAQYFNFLAQAVQGNLGNSIRSGEPALSVVVGRYPATIYLGLVAMGLALALAIPAGVYAATHRGGPVDKFLRAVAAFGQAVPQFWMGLVLALVFGVWMGVLPTSGSSRPESVILPAVTLSLYALASLMRLTRSAMIDVLGSDYVKFARSKGVNEAGVIWKHAFRNATLPVLTLAALLFVHVLNGAVIVETIFAWPGVGSLVMEAVQFRDYPVAQTVTLLMCGMFLITNLCVDVVYAFLNPKIRFAKS